MNNNIFLIGYSGHAFVVCDIFSSKGLKPAGYFDNKEKKLNPYQIPYLGLESNEENLILLKNGDYFVAIGDNLIRSRVINNIYRAISKLPINAIHKNASISSTTKLGNGVMVGNSVIINPCSYIGDGVICNTQSVIEHECKIDSYSHIAPGAVLCGNVKVGKNTFIGARTVVKQGVIIGDNVIVEAGTVIIKDIPSNSKVVGNPQRFI